MDSFEESIEGLDSLCECGKKKSSVTDHANHFLDEYFWLNVWSTYIIVPFSYIMQFFLLTFFLLILQFLLYYFCRVTSKEKLN